MISIFLAQIFALYFIIISIGMFTNRVAFKALIKDSANNNSISLIGGVIALIIGILLIVTHNHWTADWRVVITIIAWLAFIKGIIRVTAPQITNPWLNKIAENDMTYKIMAVIVLLLGIFLAYHGFFH